MNKDEKLDKCRELVIKNIKDNKDLIDHWDGKTYDKDPMEHYTDIVCWCKSKIKNYGWSHNKYCSRYGLTSYGAKHECERELKCYVANNWMKMAMIDAGLDVCNAKCIDYESGKLLCRLPIKCQEILTNNVNFIYRNDKYNYDMKNRWISDIEEELQYKI